MSSVLGGLAEAPAGMPGPAVDARPVSTALRASSQPDRAGEERRVAGMRVPATATAISEWVRMCAEEKSALGPLNDQDARARYGLTANQLRNVRHVANSGALRQKPIMLGVQLPPWYADNPADGRADGREMADATA